MYYWTGLGRGSGGEGDVAREGGREELFGLRIGRKVDGSGGDDADEGRAETFEECVGAFVDVDVAGMASGHVPSRVRGCAHRIICAVSTKFHKRPPAPVGRAALACFCACARTAATSCDVCD